MRDEDLAKLPQQVERWRVSELMQGLGFEPGWEYHTKDIQLDYHGLTVTVYARDSEGRKIARDVPTEIEVQDLGDAEPHTIQGAAVQGADHPHDLDSVLGVVAEAGVTYADRGLRRLGSLPVAGSLPCTNWDNNPGRLHMGVQDLCKCTSGGAHGQQSVRR
jgi:hypothetical protein